MRCIFDGRARGPRQPDARPPPLPPSGAAPPSDQPNSTARERVPAPSLQSARACFLHATVFTGDIYAGDGKEAISSTAHA